MSVLLQVATDSVMVTKIQSVTDSIKAHVDSLSANLVNPAAPVALTPSNVVGGIKEFDWSGVMTAISTQVVSFCLRLMAAIAIFYLGKFIINKIYSLTRSLMVKRDIDRSLTTFLLSLIRITLLFLLIVTVIGVLGIETSSFIAIFASAGVAIGMALSGTLQNFAGGVLILLLKPYKIGDYIEFGSFKGFVKEIQIFHTILTTYNNDRIIIPNGGLSTGSINNLSSETYRRLEWRVSISYGDDVPTARRAILALLDQDARIVKQYVEDHQVQEQPDTEPEEKPQLKWWQRLFRRSKGSEDEVKNQKPAERAQPKKDYTPYVAVESLADSSVVLVVRAWCLVSEYWNVLYTINEQIYTILPQHDIHFPFPQMDVHMK